MTEPSSSKAAFQDNLARLETIPNDKYEKYRMKLNIEIEKTIYRERVATHLCWVSLALSIVLMYVGGSKVLGSFDPYSDTANPLSIALGVVFIVANIVWPISLASVLSRFMPRLRALREKALMHRLEDR